ncbi:LOW QUALITY PROTEIN: uncharacterized protein LOC130416951 [Triplophysa dalaica]|uniref:LOW QUALITY PROTEIN: uncharacterized protein LOC130416951 n=1 Tax=Triplophysa dalaica TaxID=1582913 RepID=UPI0024DF319E|nr:LOW QUALITY PROTEIN: uncharacterized protein LOC130416951 [Triplophysa dalaica]
MEKRRGCATSLEPDPLRAPLARVHGADGGQGVNNNGIDGRLRECSVVLTRVRESDIAMMGTQTTHNDQPGTSGDAREAAATVQTVDEWEDDSAMVIAPAAQVTATGLVIRMPYEAHRCAICGVSMGTLVQLRRHTKVVHSGVLVRYMSISCGKTAPNHHAIAFHVPKCRGHQVARPPGPVQCEACDATFGTKRGLSIHEMHVHPAVRNRKRIASLMATLGPIGEAVEAGTTRASLVGDPDASTSSRRMRVNVSMDGGVMPLEPVASSSVPHTTTSRSESGLKVRLRELVREMIDALEGDDADNIPVLKAWLEGSDQLPAMVEAATSSLLQGLTPEARNGSAPSRRKRGRVPHSVLRRRRKGQLRKEVYSRCQHLYQTDPARLAGEILDGAVPMRCQIPLHIYPLVFRAYKSKWEEKTSFRGLGHFRAGEHADNDLLAGLISEEEVLLCLRQVAKNSAPGPDGIGKQDLLEWDPEGEALTRMFNMWWVTGIIPTRLKSCRTILLPKSVDPWLAREIGNWRPITIGSMILRVFTRILSKRLAPACPLHPSQRGFRPTPGCSENIEVLRGLIRHCKTECSSPLAVVSIDFAQAFDSVSHEHLLAALGMVKVDLHMVEMIQQLYTNLRYLGAQCNPWVGIVKPDQASILDKWVRRLAASPLKPSQKVTLLNRHAIPRLHYLADHAELGLAALNRLDRIIKGAVKEWLHLPRSTCDGLLYARNRDGGLGICKLARQTPANQARRWLRLSISSNEVVKALATSDWAKDHFRQLWRRAGGGDVEIPQLGLWNVNANGDEPCPLTPACPWPCDWRADEFRRWTELPVQGRGIAKLKGCRASNNWLRMHKGFTERCFIAALQVRANVYPTAESIVRGRPKTTTASCRLCSARLESVSHILGQCPRMQSMRILRRHKICRLLATEAEGLGWEVRREWPFETAGGESRRLDLVLIRGLEALVIDATVRFESDPNTLRGAANEKAGPKQQPYASSVPRDWISLPHPGAVPWGAVNEDSEAPQDLS